VECVSFQQEEKKDVNFNSFQSFIRNLVDLSEGWKWFFFLLVVIINIVFVIYWLYYMLQTVKQLILQKSEKLYIILFLCCKKERYSEEKAKGIQEEEEIDFEEQLRLCNINSFFIILDCKNITNKLEFKEEDVNEKQVKEAITFISLVKKRGGLLRAKRINEIMEVESEAKFQQNLKQERKENYEKLRIFTGIIKPEIITF
jgi:hypothetical protein